MINLFKKIPLFLFLLPVFFCLHGAVENYGYISFIEVLHTGLAILAGIVLFFGLIFILYRQYLAVALIVFFISLWYLFFGALHDLIKSTTWLSFVKSYSVLLPTLIIVSVAWVVIVIRKKTWWQRLTLYLNVLLLVYCCIDIAGLIIKSPYKKFKPAMVNIDASGIKGKPDIYFIVMDEYAGYTGLRDSFGFSNDNFYNFLQQQGFKILPVFANYDFTPFSMSSTLNINYLSRSGTDKKITQFDYLERLEEINNAAVFAAFKNLGYSIHNFSIFDINNIPSPNADPDNGIISMRHSLITDKILLSRAEQEIGWGISERIRKWLPFLKTRNHLSDTENNELAIQQCRKLAMSVKKEPLFCYTHVMMPHWQYYFDSAGNANPLNIIMSKATITDKKLYLGYLQYTNRVIGDLVTDIVDADPSAIVLLISDHGFRNYGKEAASHTLNFDIICAARFPDKNYQPFKDKWSTVNFFRYLFNSQFGQSLPYLEDKSIYVHE